MEYLVNLDVIGFIVDNLYPTITTIEQRRSP